MMGIVRPRQSDVVMTKGQMVEPVVNYGEWSLLS